MPEQTTPRVPDREAARRGGKASGETRRRKAQLRGDVAAKEKFEAAAGELAGVLIAAALGKDGFAKLDPKDRATFAIKALEHAIGRPRQVEPAAPETDDQRGGLHIVVGGPQGDLIGDSSDVQS